MLVSFFSLLTNISVVSRGPSFCSERAAEAESTEAVQKENTEIGPVGLQNTALPLNTSPNQITQDEEKRPG